MNKRSPLAIVGIGCRFPKANDKDQYWSNIVQGVDCISEVPRDTHWNPDDYFDADPKKPDMTYAQRGGFLDPIDFHPLDFGIPPTTIEATDTSQLLGLVVAKEALIDAGYAGDNARTFDRDRTSVILGVTGALELVVPLGARLGHPRWRKAMEEAGLDKAHIDAITQKISDSYVPWQEASFPGLLGNVVAGRIANNLDLGGSNCVVDAACASSLSAVHLAAMELQSHRADMVLTGGVDTFNDIFMYMCFSKTPALSKSGDARPFDAQGDGTMLGEGVGIVALKRLEDAQRDNDKIYAVLRGIGSSSDGKGSAIYAPVSKGQAKALRRAYKDADVDAATVQLVEGHGTGTTVGDATEIRGLSEVFRETGREDTFCAVGSVKSQIGHAKAAAGVAGLIKAALALKNKVIPPSIKVREPLEDIAQDSPFYLSPQARPWMPQKAHPRRAGVSAFGFGGSNFHVVLEEHQDQNQAVQWDGHTQILAFAASDRNQLTADIQDFPSDIGWTSLTRRAAQSRLNLKDQPHRLLLVLEKDKSDLSRLLERATTLLKKYEDKPHWSAPEGVYYGSGQANGKLGVLFPGQGSQYVGMLRDLALQFPVMQSVLADVDKAFALEFGQSASLTDLIYPIPTWNEDQAQTDSRNLQMTQHAQPAIGAVSIGALKILNQFGVTPQAAAGHSYGEITALCASQRFDTEALYLLSLLRGKLMAEGEGDRGAMVAVRAPLDQVETFVNSHKLDLVLANKNAPDQVVLSGHSTEVERAAALLQAENTSHKVLSVAAAFHSTLVASASKPFASELQKIDFSESSIPVYANTTGQPYPAEAVHARDLLANQLAQPVEFVDEITNMHNDGVRVFLEVGPGARLTGLVKSILDGKDFQAIAVDASSGKRSGAYDLARVLAQLAALGHQTDLALWDNSAQNAIEPPAKKGFAIQLTGANYIDPKTKARAEKKISPIASKAPVSKSAPQETAHMTESRPITQPPLSQQPESAPQPPAAPPAMQAPASPAHISDAVSLTQQNIMRLQQMQQETADLHRRFLQGQDTAQQHMRDLMMQQQQILSGQPIAPVQIQQPTPVPAPQPVVSAPVAQPTPTPAPQPAAQPIAVAQPTPAVVPDPQPVAPGIDVKAALINVVSEKTGYPTDMLDLSMSLDADLGIDSIKRVEIMSALQEAEPNLPEVKPDVLGSLQTLQEIADYIQQQAGETAPAPVVQAASASTPSIDVEAALINVVADKTGYPTDMLNLDMSLDADLGIDSIKRVEIMSALQEAEPNLPEVKPDVLGSLQTLGEIAAYIHQQAGAAPAAPVAQVTETSASSIDIDIDAALINVVADKTGYPTDMLTLDMSLDADLGIDSIKRVEIMSALQEAEPNLPEVKPDVLGGLQTLGEIAAYLRQQSGAPSTPAPATPSVSSGVDPESLKTALLETLADKTGYPTDMLELDMSLESDLGIDSIKRVEIFSALQEAMPGLPEAKPDQLGALQTLNGIIAFFTTQPAAAPTNEPTPQPVAESEPQSSEEAPLIRAIPTAVTLDALGNALSLSKDGEIWITEDHQWADAIAQDLQKRGYKSQVISIDAYTRRKKNDHICGLIILADDNSPPAEFLKHALFLSQFAGPGLRANNGLLATVSKLDGSFALNGIQDRDPAFGGLAGLLKTAAHEWPEVTAKAIDAEPGLETLTSLVDLFLHQSPIETGVTHKGYSTVDLQVADLPAASNTPIDKGDLILVTGGARGVTAEVCHALAQAYQPTLVLFGRSPLPEQSEPQWLQNATTENQIKQAIIAQGGVTPKEVQAQTKTILAEREIRNNIQRLTQTGATVHYQSLDVTDPQAVTSTIQAIRAQHGPIHGLIHGAGVLADRLIEDKTPEQFDLVYTTKAIGLQNLLQATQDDTLKTLVIFSSSTGRFGRTGQADYAIANEFLNKTAQLQRQTHPQTRVISINWGPWDGGMVNDALRKVFHSEGIGLIGLQRGAQYLTRELSVSSPAEIVILGAADPQNPQLPHAIAATQAQPEPAIEPTQDLDFAFEFPLNIADYPFLESHVLDGKAVLPTVLIIEWLAHSVLHLNPGFKFIGFNNLQILKGVILEPGQTIQLKFYAGTAIHDGQHFATRAELRTEQDGKPRFHARADIIVDNLPLSAEPATLQAPTGSYADQGKHYNHLFHGPLFQGIHTVSGIAQNGVSVLANTAPRPSDWIKKPLRDKWLADPLLIDSALQAVVLWGVQQHGVPSLPTAITNYRQFGPWPQQGDIRIIAQITDQKSGMAHSDIEFIADGKLIARIQGYHALLDASLKKAYTNNRLLTPAR